MSVKKERLLVTAFRCERCEAVWLPRRPFDPIEQTSLPKKCVECGSNLWNTPREREIADEHKAQSRRAKRPGKTITSG